MADGQNWALILGASSGFGGATARHFAEKGYNIIGIHLDRKATMPMAEAIQNEIREHGQQAWFFNRNAADPVAIESILDDVREQLGAEGGKIACLMHSLAFGTLLPYVDRDMKRVLQPKQLLMTTEVMAHSLVYWVQGIMRRQLMGRGGRVVAMTSAGAVRAIPTYGAVSAAKSALECHVRQLALELAPFGITSNAICAGVTDTAALRKIPLAKKLIEIAVDRNPHDRLTDPMEVAKVIAGLCDSAFDWVNGTTIYADGGEEAVAVGPVRVEG
jgi:NAD(P)-dependent dehydrogenase (short-subunit alcohol dehydrogenase family)